MLNRRLLALARGAEKPIVACIALGLAITATYAGQGFAIAEVLKRIFAGDPFADTVGLLAVIVGLQGARAVLLWMCEVAAVAAGGAVKARLRRRLYEHLLDLGPGYTVRTRTGHVLTAMVDNVEGSTSTTASSCPRWSPRWSGRWRWWRTSSRSIPWSG